MKPRTLNRRDFCGTAAAAALLAPRAARARRFTTKGGVLLFSGWATKNIGDIGHTPGTLRYLEDYCPGVPVTLWLDKGNNRVIRMLQARFPRVPIVRGRLDDSGKADNPALQKAFDRCQVFLHNSGMHFNDRWPPPENLLTACAARGKPVGLYGQSFDGFAPADRARLVERLSRTAFIYTRDVESLYYLRDIGVRSPILEFGPDGCFGIDVRDDATADRFLAAHDLEPRRFITVTLRTDTWVDGVRGPYPEIMEAWASQLRRVITQWVKTTGLRVLLAPEVEKEIESAQALLYERLPADIRSHVVQRETFWNVDEAASVYARAHTVVALEPHSCIIALAFGTPAIHFFNEGHGRKAWMFRDIGLPEWLVTIDRDNAELVSTILTTIRRDYPRAQEKVDRAMAFVHRRSAEMMATVRALL
ncbi:MAG: polysaccharide pyruvyl transferase family protein [Acidobacteria bacterium]|nr:polysaccharide pyruvyl transferase family protein [Acidobacteriota bacterium]